MTEDSSNTPSDPPTVEPAVPNGSIRAWEFLLDTHQRAERIFENWIVRRLLPEDDASKVLVELRAQRSLIEQSRRVGKELPTIVGFLPPTDAETDEVKKLRLLEYARALIVGYQDKSLIAEIDAGGLERDLEAQIRDAEQKLAGQNVNVADLRSRIILPARILKKPGGKTTTGRQQDAATPEDHAAGPSLLERLLDPRSLQWLMGVGGMLMVAGLVILLWINDFFTPPITAVSLGLVNCAVPCGGFYCLKYTKQKLAGKALTLLSCLVMPLNLWYYSANDLITLDGHLWMPAVVMCGIYAAAAILLKDKLFVYIFSAGISLTGLLMIADLPPSPSKFWEIRLPSSFLILLGLASIHAERVFTAAKGAFSRNEFGSAFFRAGHLQMAAGLALIFGAHVAGDWLYEPVFFNIYESLNAEPSPMCGALRWLSLLLVGLATYGYIYSDLVVRRNGLFIHIGAFTLIWAEVLTVQLLDVQLGPTPVIVVLAVTSILVNIGQYYFVKQGQATSDESAPNLRGLPYIGLILGYLPVAIGLLVFARSFEITPVLRQVGHDVSFVGAMLLTAAGLRIGAKVYSKNSDVLRVLYFAGSAASVLIATSAGAALLGLERWSHQAPLLMLVAIGYLIASHWYRSRESSIPTMWVAHSSAAVILLTSVLASLPSLLRQPGSTDHWIWAFIFAEGAVFYALASWRKQPVLLGVSIGFAVLSGVQVLGKFDAGAELHILALGVLGLAMVLFYRVSNYAVAPSSTSADSDLSYLGILHIASNSILSLALVGSGIYGLFQLLALADGRLSSLDVSFTTCILSMLAIALVAISASVNELRVWYTVIAVAHVVLGVLTLHNLLDLSPWQKIEIFAILAGVTLLAIGHVGWYREQLTLASQPNGSPENQRSELVGNCLAFGALLSAVPLAIATWIHRYNDSFVILDEFGFLFVSILLLTSGVVLQLRSTTLVGAGMTAMYFATFLVLVPWGQVNTVATAILTGGSVLFGTGLILAFYREQILRLPELIQNRQGVFRVMDWR